MVVPERKRKTKSKLVSYGEGGVKTERFKRKHKKEKRDRRERSTKRDHDRKVSRRKHKPNPAFFQPDEETRMLYFDSVPSKKTEKPYPGFFHWAELGLAEYTREHGAEFKVVRIEKECCTFIPFLHNQPWGWLLHSFFKAVPTNSTDDSSVKTFFAEISLGEGPKAEVDVVNACCIVEPDDPGTKLGCRMCPAEEPYLHPESGFVADTLPFAPPPTLME